MEIDSTIPPAEPNFQPRANLAEDPYIADLLQVADSRIAELERQVADLSDEKEISDRKLTTFRQQVGIYCMSRSARKPVFEVSDLVQHQLV